jgi:hypothetical protein
MACTAMPVNNATLDTGAGIPSVGCKNSSLWIELKFG